MKTEREIQDEVIAGISALILNHLNRAACQQYAPGSDPDESDHRIADGERKADRLRNIRNNFEAVVSGIIP